MPIFIYNITLQNTDFGVLQKSSKHVLISIFFPPGEGHTPSLSHTHSLLRVSNNEYLFLYNFVVKNVLPIFIYNIALQNTDFYIQYNLTKY